MKKYTSIVRDLLMNGKQDLIFWNKEEFIACCELDYGVTEKTAEKVYNEYHRIMGQV